MVRNRKNEDRRREAEEAAAIAAAAAAAEEEARRAAEEAARPPAEARIGFHVNETAETEDPLAGEWAQSFADHRARLRAERDFERRRKQYEEEGMLREDAAARAFTAAADAECYRRAAAHNAGSEDARLALTHAKVVWAKVEAEKQWQRQEAEAQARAEEARLRAEEERKDRDYETWRESVRSQRCRERRQHERGSPINDPEAAEERRRLLLQGRDPIREQEAANRALVL